MGIEPIDRGVTREKVRIKKIINDLLLAKIVKLVV